MKTRNNNRRDYSVTSALEAITARQTKMDHFDNHDARFVEKLGKAVGRVQDGAPYADFTLRGVRHVVKAG